MIQAVRRASAVAAAVFLWSTVLVGAASAYQALPDNARINEWNTGMPGIDWNTPPAGVDYDDVGAPVEAHDGELWVNGTVPTLNYHLPGDPTTNLNSDFVPDLEFTLEGEILGVSVEGLGGSWVKLDTYYDTTDDGVWDLILTDPGDGDAEVLRANLIAGTFNGSPVAALTATATVDAANINPNQLVTAFAFLDVDPTSPYASLFTDTEYVGFNISQVLDWEIGDADGSYDFDDIANALIDDFLAGTLSESSLISFTAEADGAVFGISASDFIPIPEPGSGLLVGLGLLLLGLRRR